MKYDWIRKAGLTFYPNSGMKINGTPLHLRKARLLKLSEQIKLKVYVLLILTLKEMLLMDQRKYMKQILFVLPGIIPTCRTCGCSWLSLPLHFRIRWTRSSPFRNNGNSSSWFICSWQYYRH